MNSLASPSHPPPARRSVLFVGALALEGLAPALAGPADAVCIDLEDAVPPAQKAQALREVLKALSALDAAAAARTMVRINSLRTVQGITDLQAFLVEQPPLWALLLPKVETEDELRWAAALAEDAGSPLQFLCIIETPSGLEHCRAIAAVHPRLAGLFFGGFDLSTALGAEMAWEPLLYARSRVVHAAAGAGLQVIDAPFQSLGDLAGLQASAAQARALGITGKTAKHPSQIEAINQAFSPSPAELAYAQRALAAHAEDPGKPLLLDGKLVELPTLKRLQRLVAGAQPR